MKDVIDLVFWGVMLFCIYSMVQPWEHKQFDIIEIDGLLIDADFKPQIGFMIEKETVSKEWKCIFIGIPFLEIQIQYGNSVKKGMPRG